jgi:peptide/nickel transport system permease protein
MSGFWRYAIRRALLIPVQLVFVLFVLYVVFSLAETSRQGPAIDSLAYFRGFAAFVQNNFEGHWGVDTTPLVGFGVTGQPWSQLIADSLPPSIQLTLFSLPIAAAVAYPVSMLAGWSRRPWLDGPARFVSIVASLLPVFVLAVLVYNGAFFWFENHFQDPPGAGLAPSTPWFWTHGGYPAWYTNGFASHPTGLPLFDALIHHDWTVAEISFAKTILQASVVAIAYVAIFFRHARAVVRSVRDEHHIESARSWGVSERRLLWRYAARRATPSFLLIFALTIPEFLGVLFAVEVAFIDQRDFGYLLYYNIGNPQLLVALVFLVAVFVIVWTYVVDLIAVRLDPRGAMAR